MKLLRQIIEGFSCWINSVAETINSLFDRLRSQRHVQFIEEEHDTFTFHELGNGKSTNLPDHRVRIVGGSIVEDLATKLGGDLAWQPDRTDFATFSIPISPARIAQACR